MEQELLNNIKTFFSSGELVYKAKDYTSATILYFKCLFVLLDYIIFLKFGKTPKDHTERFRMLEHDFPDLYVILDKYFWIYRDTYSQTIEREKCNEVRDNVRSILKQQKITQ
jgi:uncharacterized protein (UPF0332 family)